MEPFDRLGDFLLVIVTLSLRRIVFDIFDLVLYSEFEARVRGHSRSSELSRRPIDPPPMTSY